MRTRKPTRDEALARLDEAERTGFIVRMIATYLLAGREPDVDVLAHDVRVRAFGLHRADGGYVALTVEHEGPSAVMRAFETWAIEIDRMHCAYTDADLTARTLALREAVPMIRARAKAVSDRRGF